MHYSEMATIRVPWVGIVADGEGTTTENVNLEDGNVEGGYSQPRRHSQYQRRSRTASGRNTLGHLPTPNQPHHNLPQAPSASSSSSPLDWVNSELMSLSLSSFGRRAGSQSTSHATDSPQTRSGTHSRSESPERNPSGSSGFPTASDGHGQGTGRGHLRSLSSLFKATMKPFTALSPHHNGGHGLFSLSKSPSPPDDNHHVPSSGPSSRRTSPSRRASVPGTLPSTTSSGSSGQPLQPSHSASSDLHRSISEVPDYSVASQGFMGGVPPLSSLVGLPSYDEAAREDRRRPQADSSHPNEHNILEGPSSSSRNRGNSLVAGPSSSDMDNVTDTTRRETVSDANLLGRFGESSRMDIRQSFGIQGLQRE
jgi:hypothetical protein